MARCAGGMQTFSGSYVTGRAGTASDEVLTNCAADQGTGGRIVTATTCVMNFRITIICQRWRITVTASTGGSCDCYQRIVDRSVGRVSRFPGVGVTAAAISRSSFTECQAY